MSKRVIEFESYSKSSKYRALKIINQESSSDDEPDHSLGSSEDSRFLRHGGECVSDAEYPEVRNESENHDENYDPLNLPMTDEEENNNSSDDLEVILNDDDDGDTEGTESETESEDDDPEIDEDEGNHPLFPGALITVAQSLVAILVFTLRHKITGSCLSDLLELISLHCPPPNRCCKTLYRFRKFFANIQSPVIRHFYCSICFAKLVSTNSRCNRCAENSSSTSYFLEVPILCQIRKLFKRPGFYRGLDHRFDRQKKIDDNLEDIYDGEIYKSLSDNGFLSNPANISFTWNTDGVVLFKSSKFNIWPFYFVINELPYNQRMNRDNLILAGLWFGEKKPEANLFTASFRESLQQLYRGLDFDVPDIGNSVRVRGILMCGTCDSPAKSLFLNMKQFNGTFGCPKCKIRTERVENVQVYPYQASLNMRTTEECINNAREAFESQQPIEGVKGPTVISQICHDFINTTAIDVMHCIYLGIVKKLMKLWFDDSYAGFAFSLVRFRNLVDGRISVAPPAMIQRILRKISDHAYWKASELKIWLLYYSITILKDIMKPEYFEHHKLLVFSITTLNEDSISVEMINNASCALHKYVSRFENFYGLRHMTSNVHLLLHLPDVVKQLGPLWVTSCFPFENANGMLKSLVHGTRYAQLQICSSVSIFANLSELKTKFLTPQSNLERYCDKLGKASKRRRKASQIADGSFIIGKVVKLGDPTPVILNALFNSGVVFNNAIQTFTRFLKDGIFYNSESYSRLRKYNSSFVTFDLDGVNRLGIIHAFVKISDCVCDSVCINCTDDAKFLAILTPLNAINTFSSSIENFTIKSIYRCHRLCDSDMMAISVCKLKSVCFHTEINHELHVIEPVNSKEFE